MEDKCNSIHGDQRGRVPGTNHTTPLELVEDGDSGCWKTGRRNTGEWKSKVRELRKNVAWCMGGMNHTRNPGDCLLLADVDECTQSPGLCGRGVCENLPGSFRCVCPAGFRGSTCEEDVDECAQHPPPCGPGRCDNTAGSFHCACPAGFRSRGPGAPCQGKGAEPRPGALCMACCGGWRE